MIIRDNHVVFEPNDIEHHDPGDHDDGIEKAVERYLAELKKAYGRPAFDMMMGRGPSSPEADAYIARVKADQDRVIAKHQKIIAELREKLEVLTAGDRFCPETHQFGIDRLGERARCNLPRGHAGDHEDARGHWWRVVR